MQDNTKGALLMMGSMAGFTFNDTMVKLTGGEVPLFQLVFLRGVLASFGIYLIARYLGAVRLTLPRRDWALVLIRSAAEIAATVFFLSALFRMPLANVTAVLQILPLSVALGAALIFREQVGWRRWLAIAVGFCGMLLIVRPGPEGFSTATLYALITVVCATIRDLATRRMSSAVPSMMVSLCAALSVTIFAGLASLPGGWAPVSAQNALYILGAAGFILGAYLCSVMVMRVGDVSFTAPFRYTGLIWALILGYLIWGDWPTPLTLLGAGIVVSMGLYTLFRENRLARKNLAHRLR
ncbi:DMT family transporter [Primorskyibacter aestuariivivens]|uniref:DMT family transporter n=1 Tax=Primorskyibacter aestuariivivens TaxID=1888912 RepID=UPI0022FFD78F|nr:DMT family transporter [Primorskyibacter aestuariivivens]MDA7428597.1 DMT family transporter [Primorskyibacter aestuariivivens]